MAQRLIGWEFKVKLMSNPVKGRYRVLASLGYRFRHLKAVNEMSYANITRMRFGPDSSSLPGLRHYGRNALRRGFVTLLLLCNYRVIEMFDRAL